MSAKFQLSISDSWADRPPSHDTDPLEYPVTGIFLFLGKGNGSMARVLKIASGLMGVLLLVMVGVMGAGRHGKDGPQPMMILNMEPSSFEGRIYLVGPDTGIAWAVTPKLVISTMTVLPDETVLFVGGTYKGAPKLNNVYDWAIYQLRPDGSQAQLVVSEIAPNEMTFQITHLIASPSKEYIFGVGESEDGSLGLYSFSIYTGQVKRLSEASLDLPRSDSHCCVFSSDGTEVVFSAANDQDVSDLYKVNIEQDTSLNLTSAFGQETYVQLWPEGQDWLIIEENRRLYRLWLTDGRIERLIAEEDADTIHYRETVADWLPKERLLIVSARREYDASPYKSTLFAIPIDTSIPLWKIDNVNFGGISPDRRWVFLHNYAGDDSIDLMRMPLQGGEPESVAHVPDYREIWGFTKDGKWLLYTGPVQGLGLAIWRVQIPNGTPELLAPMDNIGEGAFWSDDREWILYTDYGVRNRPYRIRVDGQHHEQIIITPHATTGWGLGWAFAVNRHWQPAILAAIALTLITTPVLISRLHFRPHPRPHASKHREGS